MVRGETCKVSFLGRARRMVLPAESSRVTGGPGFGMMRAKRQTQTEMKTRRQFLRDFSLATTSLALVPSALADEGAGKPGVETASFFLVGDTHYRADDEGGIRMDEDSAAYNARLVDWMNRLPGTTVPDLAGGGTLAVPHGVIHAGDLVDSGDKGKAKEKVAEAEMTAWMADWGLNGGDAKLRWAVREIHGNHDAPHGDTPVLEAIKARTKKRAGLANVSANGLHYSWDWAGVHFVALGIVVGDAPEITRKRRYSPLGSLPFLKQDLADHVGTSGRPVVLVHHVDVHRYSQELPDDLVVKQEWDYGDTHAFYETVKPYRIAATLCGHTHVRKIARWNGTKDDKTRQGIPFLNTDNGAHFGSPKQAILHVEVNPGKLLVREFATEDGWTTGAWTPQTWQFPLPA